MMMPIAPQPLSTAPQGAPVALSGAGEALPDAAFATLVAAATPPQDQDAAPTPDAAVPVALALPVLAMLMAAPATAGDPGNPAPATPDSASETVPELAADAVVTPLPDAIPDALPGPLPSLHAAPAGATADPLASLRAAAAQALGPQGAAWVDSLAASLSPQLDAHATARIPLPGATLALRQQSLTVEVADRAAQVRIESALPAVTAAAAQLNVGISQLSVEIDRRQRDAQLAWRTRHPLADRSPSK